jgi:hypothetical protein
VRTFAISALVVLLTVGSGYAFDGTMPIPVPGASHIFAPGPRSLGLPGLVVNPSSIGDFAGVVALAYVKGRAVGSDGRRFLMANDMRIMSGAYLAADGSPHSGSFAFI